VEQDRDALRSPEQPSVPALRTYLRQSGFAADTLVVERFPHGHSNLTYLVRMDGQEWVLRRRPAGVVPPRAHDMAREFRILSTLADVYELAPRPIVYCGDEAVIGAPFYLMERRRGVILRGLATEFLPLGDGTLERLCRAFADNLARLHEIDYQRLGLGDLGRPEGYLSRQIDRWRRRYPEIATTTLPEMDEVGEWLERHTPAESGAALIHNDYKFDNLVVDPDDPAKIVAVLDWEMATIGDPLADLGTTLGLWVQADDPEPLRAAWVSPASRPDSLTRAAIVEIYGERRGRPVSNPVFYYALGLFKLAVIFQQLYLRHHQGETTDTRLATFDRTVAALVRQASRAISADRV
jgi:aminoglycoside phosphotransferase (APT) family kinase protein